MKKITGLLLSLFVFFASAAPVPQITETGDTPLEKLQKECGVNFHYKLHKNYSITEKSSDRGIVEYTAFLPKGSDNIFGMTDHQGKAEGIVMSIYDAKRNLIATTYHKGEYEKTLNLKVEETGLYYISFSFKKECTSRCCAAFWASR